MNRLMPILLIVACAAPLAAAAQSTEPTPAPVSADEAVQPSQPATDAELAKDKDKESRAEPYCLRHTGSLIRQTGRQRCTAIGSAYTREDLQRTGETDISDALRKLDSSIR